MFAKSKLLGFPINKLSYLNIFSRYLVLKQFVNGELSNPLQSGMRSRTTSRDPWRYNCGPEHMALENQAAHRFAPI